LQLRLIHEAKILRVFEKLEEPFGFGLADFDAIKQEPELFLYDLSVLDVGTVFGMKFLNELLRLGEESVAQTFLSTEQRFDLRPVLGILFVVSDHRGAADDERGACFIDQD
jgi:hypothetical protein